MEPKNQNIIIVVLSLIHVFITIFWFYVVGEITEFVPALDEELPMQYHLIHVTTMAPIITAIILGGYFFKHRQTLSKKKIIHIWWSTFPPMILLSVICLVVAIFDPKY